MTVIAVSALTACGTREADDGAGSAGADLVSADTREAPSAPGGDPEVAFTHMLVAVSDPCLPDVSVEPVETVEPTEIETPAEQPLEGKPVGGSPPPMPTSNGADEHPQQEPATEQDPEPELDAEEECVGRLHVERIGKEFDSLTDTSPEQIRAALNRLGYIDGRILGLERTEELTRFVLDLRFMGSRLCISGDVTASEAVIEAFAASPGGKIRGVRPTG